MRSGSKFCNSSIYGFSLQDEAVCLSSHQASQLVGVSPSTIVDWINRGRLPAFRTPGGHRRIKVGDLRRFLASTRMPLPPALRERPTTKRVFVVDDEPAVIRAIQRELDKHGGPYEVDGCTSGVEALVRIGAVQPDLVLLDIYMEGLDGFEVCRRLRGIPELERLLIVAITAQPTDEARKRIMDCGAADYWVKPVRAEQVTGLLEPAAVPAAQPSAEPGSAAGD